MGHYCRICGRMRPNESFSGKGHRIHVCKRCAQRPKEERQRIERSDEIAKLILSQSHISKENVARLRLLATSSDPMIAELAELALEVEKISPCRKHRFKKIHAQNRELRVKLEKAGLWPYDDGIYYYEEEGFDTVDEDYGYEDFYFPDNKDPF